MFFWTESLKLGERVSLGEESWLSYLILHCDSNLHTHTLPAQNVSICKSVECCYELHDCRSNIWARASDHYLELFDESLLVFTCHFAKPRNASLDDKPAQLVEKGRETRLLSGASNNLPQLGSSFQVIVLSTFEFDE